MDKAPDCLSKTIFIMMLKWIIATLAAHALSTSAGPTLRYNVRFDANVVLQVQVQSKEDHRADCICTDTEHVPVFAEACGEDEVKEHTWGACWRATGQARECGGHSWLQLNYDNIHGTVWVKAEDAAVSPQSNCSGSGGSCGHMTELVTREEWGARPPRNVTKFKPPMSMVFVHHSAMPHCYTKVDCIDMVREIQDLHMDGNKWDDIGYNFLVGEDGRVYEGRGWDNMPAQAKGHNAYSYGICIMGNFMEDLPLPVAAQAVKDMIDCGIQQGKVTLGHEEFGHRDGRCTACPGDAFYPQLQTWPRYSTRNITVVC